MQLPYQNPYSLHYYLTEDIPSEVEKQVLQKIQTQWEDFHLTFAIIGSSHFFCLESYFCELLTCLPPTLLENLFFHHQTHENFVAKKDFHKFEYQFSLFFTQLERPHFEYFEQDLFQQNHLLYQAFEGEKSAITSIQLTEKQKHILRVQTWHTYPENQIIVQSQTTIRAKNWL